MRRKFSYDRIWADKGCFTNLTYRRQLVGDCRRANSNTWRRAPCPNPVRSILSDLVVDLGPWRVAHANPQLYPPVHETVPKPTSGVRVDDNGHRFRVLALTSQMLSAAESKPASCGFTIMAGGNARLAESDCRRRSLLSDTIDLKSVPFDTARPFRKVSIRPQGERRTPTP